MVKSPVRVAETVMRVHIRRKRQKGANMVEMALVLLTLMGMILFVVDMGRILLTEQFITERTRTTLRQAVVNNWTTTQMQNVLCYNSTAAGTGPGYMGLITSNVTAAYLGSSSAPDYRLQIKVSGVTVSTWVPGMAGSYTLPTVTLTMPAESLGATD